VVTFPPQHVSEQVFQEHVSGGAPEDPALPALARFAYASRLAFDVPVDEVVELTTSGILAAMSRLPLSVAPLAVPRMEWRLLDASMAPVVPLAAPERIASGRTLVIERVRATELLVAEGAPDVLRRLPADARRALAGLTGAERLAVAGPIADAVVDGRIDRDLLDRILLRPTPRLLQATETAIEAPSRLQLSPSVRGGWAHATTVAEGTDDGDGPVELWHTRLGVRKVGKDGTVSVDETDPTQRIVRGVWTRDLASTWDGPRAADNVPFTASTSATDRIQIVGQSSGVDLPARIVAKPVDVNRLHLSSLGAFMDVRGAWDARKPDFSLEEWQHRTTLGRDQYVKVVYAGYLYCFGHRVSYVKETRRKVDPHLPDSDTAILWQRHFLILKERTRWHSGLGMPFSSVTLSPAVSPDLDQPEDLANLGDGQTDPPHLFWPTVSGQPFLFTVTAVDRNGKTHVFPAPLLFVLAPMNPAVGPKVLQAYGLTKDAAGFKHTAPNDSRVELATSGAHIALAPSGPSGNARFETRTLRFAADPGDRSSDPALLFADLVVPAVAALTGSKVPLRLTYAAPYLSNGFGAGNEGEVVLATARDAPSGKVAFSKTDGSGGFVNPSQKVDGVSRSRGPVADVATSATGGAVNPASYFAGMGKLFGLFDLADVLQALTPGEVPAYAARLLDIAGAVDGHVDHVIALLPASPERNALQAAVKALDDVMAAPAPDVASTVTQLQPLVAGLGAEVAAATASAALASLGPVPKALAARALDTMAALVSNVGQAATMLAHLAHGEPVAQALSHVHLEWSPRLKSTQVFTAPEKGLLLAVDARGGDLVANPSVDVLAQLSDFTLHLVPGAPLLDIHFVRLLFRAGTARKAEVDVVLGGLEWKGILGFVQNLKDLIPLDGFSDPPAIEVSEKGIKAGFSLALPNVAVGVFNLSNMALSADVQLPFLGDAPTVGFAFCSRERPFTLAVMFLGGGGFFGLRLNPEGVVLLEASLEFGACLAIDFGVASGSVSVMAGVYLRLEAAKGSLTGYLRIRGEVDVLGLISASIEMYMGLTYEFGSGKVVGRAKITVEVEVLFFSASVSISCERKFAGSAGDPTLADVMGPYADDGPWVEYCRAFVGGA